jgi:hypothetical protein
MASYRASALAVILFLASSAQAEDSGTQLLSAAREKYAAGDLAASLEAAYRARDAFAAANDSAGAAGCDAFAGVVGARAAEYLSQSDAFLGAGECLNASDRAFGAWVAYRRMYDRAYGGNGSAEAAGYVSRINDAEAALERVRCVCAGECPKPSDYGLCDEAVKLYRAGDPSSASRYAQLSRQRFLQLNDSGGVDRCDALLAEIGGKASAPQANLTGGYGGVSRFWRGGPVVDPYLLVSLVAMVVGAGVLLFVKMRTFRRRTPPTSTG